MAEQLSDYKSRAVRALVLLHAAHLRQCLAVWKQAKAANVKLPKTQDERYKSLETLLKHILGAAGGYITWICQQLERPDPGIAPVPDADMIGAEADGYLEHLLERWTLPLVSVEDAALFEPEYTFGTRHYCLDSALQHAVMHPIRHGFQLQELIRQQEKEAHA